MEEYPTTPEVPRLTVSHDDAINDPGCRQRYKDERVSFKNAGMPVWMLSGLEAQDFMEPGIVLEFYKDSEMKGYIKGNDLDGYEVYGLKTGLEERPHRLNTETIMLRSAAQRLLEDVISDTSLQDQN
ncbi:hypothetical protein HYS84_00985 [Candidatus Saccharibacteria bacterium]|nr:hypothetical protein [Candidatus Saccharibacteria bacterium]